jgi:hypothetical protein
MRKRFTSLALVATLMSMFILTPAVPADAQGQGQGRGQNRGGLVLDNVTGPILGGAGGTFTGTATITRLQYRQDRLLADGVLTGTVGGQQVDQQFRDVPLDLTSSARQGAAPETDMALKQVGGCDILNLDLGPIFLDLLGLQVDLDPVVLDITAVPGPGNLLGNLLCALVGLLDPGSGLGDLINDLLGIINRILSRL